MIQGARTQVEAVLAAEPGSATTAAPRASAGCEGPVGESFPAIPGYALSRLVHRGGQGVVYEATQLSTHRRVAVKFLRVGGHSSLHDQSRLEREVEVLTQLDHPNIVTVHDSGRISGQSYYVMTFIDGVPLDEWFSGPRVRPIAQGRAGREHGPRRTRWRKADENSVPSFRSAVELFAKVCEAVNAAHLKGIIHRDLKPSNILIDPTGEPKVLDFGLAKSMVDAEPDNEASAGGGQALTMTGQFIGSLPWASPEQAAGTPELLDTRTDVYSLGVLLYHTVTSQFPYPVFASPERVLDHIRRTEPTPPRKVNAAVDDELAVIVLKCLSKDRERRYQTAGELARDLKHYLRGEAIEARRDSAWYVLRKALRRHRAAVGSAVSAVALTIVFAGFMVVQAGRAARERDVAAAEREKARRVQAFLQSMFASIAPENMPASDFSVRTILDDGAARVDVEFADLPEEAAAIHETLGDTYDGVGLFAEAEHHLRRALELRREVLGDENAIVARTMAHLGRTIHNKQDLSAAEPIMREALALRRRVLGPRHEDVAESLNNLAELLVQLNRYDECEAVAREALAMRRELFGESHPTVAPSLAVLGSCLSDRGQRAQAEPLVREAVNMIRRLQGEDHPAYTRSMMTLAEIREAQGDVDEAEVLLREIVERRRRRMGEEHPALAWNLLCLGQLLLEHRADPDGAEPLVRQALRVQLSRRGPDAQETADCQYVLASIFAARGDCASAMPLFQDCLRIQRERFPKALCATPKARRRIAECLREVGSWDEAERLFQE